MNTPANALLNANPRTVWLLTDGAPGHLSQSRGLVDALARLGPVEVIEVRLAVQSKALKRLGRLLSGFSLLPFALAAGAWLGITGTFCRDRLRDTRRSPGHVLEMAVTSAVIPPVSLFWRLYGAVRYRVRFC